MSNDRRAILSLVASGHCTPREAERLLAVAADGDEGMLRLAILLAIAWLALPQIQQLVAALVHGLGAWLPGLAAHAHRGLALISGILGGVL